MPHARFLGFVVVAALVGLISLCWIGPFRFWQEPVPSPTTKHVARTYRETVGFSATALRRKACFRFKEGRHFECSDGTKLYVITECFPTKAAADDALARRNRLATSVNVGESTGEHAAFGYETTSEMAFELPSCFSPQTFAVLWARGNCVVGIYGPSLEHVRELEASVHPV